MRCNIVGCTKTVVNLTYQVQKNNTKHLLGKCPVHGIRFLPFVPNLDINAYPTKNKLMLAQQKLI